MHALVLLLFFQIAHSHKKPSASTPAPLPPTVQSGIFGIWRARDKSVLDVYPCGVTNGQGDEPSVACIRLLEPSANAGANPPDEENPDPQKRQLPLRFRTVGTGFKVVDPNSAVDGKLYDPNNGRTYGGTITLKGNQLKIHGSRFFFFGHTLTCRPAHLAKPSPYRR